MHCLCSLLRDTGLDASTALTLCTLLKDLAKRRMMLVSSIHQPR
jgi:ABC-type multidrug transport system ATPase subunit